MITKKIESRILEICSYWKYISMERAQAIVDDTSAEEVPEALIDENRIAHINNVLNSFLDKPEADMVEAGMKIVQIVDTSGLLPADDSDFTKNILRTKTHRNFMSVQPNIDALLLTIKNIQNGNMEKTIQEFTTELQSFVIFLDFHNELIKLFSTKK